MNHFYTRHGRPAGKFETKQALAHLAFVPDRPFLLGAAPFGSLVGVELRAGSSGRLAADIVWEEAVLSNVGRLTTSGDGGVILASCYTHGVQRYDLRGRNEGAYHLGGTAAHAVPDFAGRVIAVATLEGELVILSPGGQVRWRTGLARPAIALETDPLGRFVIYGQATGEIVRIDLEPSSRPAAAAGPSRGKAVGGPARLRPVPDPDPEGPHDRSGAPTGRFRSSPPTSRPRPPSWPSWTTRPGSAWSPAPIGSRSSRRRDGTWASPPRSRGSAGSCAPLRAGSPRRPIVRSSSSTPGATPPRGSTSASPR